MPEIITARERVKLHIPKDKPQSSQRTQSKNSSCIGLRALCALCGSICLALRRNDFA
jgi:hypothetical protein